LSGKLNGQIVGLAHAERLVYHQQHYRGGTLDRGQLQVGGALPLPGFLQPFKQYAGGQAGQCHCSNAQPIPGVGDSKTADWLRGEINRFEGTQNGAQQTWSKSAERRPQQDERHIRDEGHECGLMQRQPGRLRQSGQKDGAAVPEGRRRPFQPQRQACLDAGDRCIHGPDHMYTVGNGWGKSLDRTGLS
jgi:hypothetical protein